MNTQEDDYDSDTDEDLDMFVAVSDDEDDPSSSGPHAPRTDMYTIASAVSTGVPYPPAAPLLTAGPVDRLGQQQVNTPCQKVSIARNPVQAPRRKRVRQEWTEEEERLFLTGLRLHGIDWAEVDKLIPTRTRTQIRTHYRYFARALEKNTINDLYGVGKKVKLRKRGRPRLKLRHREGEEEKQLPKLMVDIIETVRKLHESQLKQVMKTVPVPKTPQPRRIQPHDNFCTKFPILPDPSTTMANISATTANVSSPMRLIAPAMVGGRLIVPKIQTVDASCNVSTEVFGFRLARRKNDQYNDETDSKGSGTTVDGGVDKESMDKDDCSDCGDKSKTGVEQRVNGSASESVRRSTRLNSAQQSSKQDQKATEPS